MSGERPMRVSGGAHVVPAEAEFWEQDRPKRQYPEERLQRDIVFFLTWALPPEAVAFHIPNGGLRSKKQAARLRGLGVVAGIPDLCVVWRGHAIFLELKAAGGALSGAQRAMHSKLVYCGASVALCRSVDDVEAVLRRCAVPLRGRVSA